MRIGIDCRAMFETSGIGYYTQCLVQALVQQYPADEFVLFIHPDQAGQLQQLFQATGVEIVALPDNLLSRLPLLGRHLQLARLIRRAQLDLYHSPTGSLPLGMLPPAVVTVHDLAIYQHPEWFPDGQWWSRRVIVPRSLRRSEHIIAVSDSTAVAIQEEFALPPERLTTISEAAAPAPLRVQSDQAARDYAELHITAAFILAIGTIEPRKNLIRLIQAFEKLVQSDPALADTQLVLAGRPGWKYEPILEAVRASPVASQIRLAGAVTDDLKQLLLHRARVLAFPSLWEGFGLPLLEAFQAGLPVVASTAGALPEVAGPAAVLVDPLDVDSITAGLYLVLTDPVTRRELTAAGRRRAPDFSWERAATETHRVYEQVVLE